MRSASASLAGWIVAPSRRKTPLRKTGERIRPASASSESGTASSATPSACAASTSSPIERSCAGAAEMRSIPASRNQTSAPVLSQNARTPRTISSPARATASAPSSPKRSRSRGRWLQ